MDQNFSCGHMYVCGSIQFLPKGLETSLRLLNNFLSVCNFHVFHLLISVQWYLKMLKERMCEKGVWDSCETDPSFWLDGSPDDGLGDSGQCGSGAMESSSYLKITYTFFWTPMLARDWVVYTHRLLPWSSASLLKQQYGCHTTWHFRLFSCGKRGCRAGIKNLWIRLLCPWLRLCKYHIWVKGTKMKSLTL